MASPFTQFDPPTVVRAMGAILAGTEIVSTATIRLTTMSFCNTTAAPITITVTNTAGIVLANAVEIPPGVPVDWTFTFRSVTGLRWTPSAPGLNGQVEGY